MKPTTQTIRLVDGCGNSRLVVVPASVPTWRVVTGTPTAPSARTRLDRPFRFRSLNMIEFAPCGAVDAEGLPLWTIDGQWPNVPLRPAEPWPLTDTDRAWHHELDTLLRQDVRRTRSRQLAFLFNEIDEQLGRTRKDNPHDGLDSARPSV